MKDRIDISLLNGDDAVKRSLSFIANNAGRVVAVLTFIFASLIIFTDVTLCDFSLKSFGVLLLLMIIASYIIYFSMEDAGEKLGEDSEEYAKARFPRWREWRRHFPSCNHRPQGRSFR